MKLIGVDAVLEIVDRERLFGNGNCGKVRDLIEDLPEVVIRCRNCKYCSNPSWLHGWNGICTKSFFNVPEYHYCSYGERKTNEAN